MSLGIFPLWHLSWLLPLRSPSPFRSGFACLPFLKKFNSVSAGRGLFCSSESDDRYPRLRESEEVGFGGCNVKRGKNGDH